MYDNQLFLHESLGYSCSFKLKKENTIQKQSAA